MALLSGSLGSSWFSLSPGVLMHPLLQRSLGSLERIKAIPRITVYVQSAETFTLQSEVADGASEILFTVLGSVGAHSRTSVGVLQLPKNATVEIDLIATIEYSQGR